MYLVAFCVVLTIVSYEDCLSIAGQNLIIEQASQEAIHSQSEPGKLSIAYKGESLSLRWTIGIRGSQLFALIEVFSLLTDTMLIDFR